MKVKFSYNEALLGLTSVVSAADGVFRNAETDARVHMVINEKISTTEIDSFKSKYDELENIDETYSSAIESLQTEPADLKAKALAYMYLVANVASDEEDNEVTDLDHLEEIEDYINDDKYVDLEELVWINKAKKDLKISLSAMKQEFEKIPAAKRI